IGSVCCCMPSASSQDTLSLPDTPPVVCSANPASFRAIVANATAILHAMPTLQFWDDVTGQRGLRDTRFSLNLLACDAVGAPGYQVQGLPPLSAQRLRSLLRTGSVLPPGARSLQHFDQLPNQPQLGPGLRFNGVRIERVARHVFPQFSEFVLERGRQCGLLDV